MTDYWDCVFAYIYVLHESLWKWSRWYNCYILLHCSFTRGKNTGILWERGRASVIISSVQRCISMHETPWTRAETDRSQMKVRTRIHPSIRLFKQLIHTSSLCFFKPPSTHLSALWYLMSIWETTYWAASFHHSCDMRVMLLKQACVFFAAL